MAKRGVARLIDFSYTDKKSKQKRLRWYIYIETPELVEDPDFPFSKGDKLFVHLEEGKLVVEKM